MTQNISVNKSRRNNLKTHGTIHESINEVVNNLFVKDPAFLTINIPAIQNTKCSTENTEGISCGD